VLHDLDYGKLPEDLKDILTEADRHTDRLKELMVEMYAALRYYGLIPASRIDMIRIRDGENYERLIPLKPR
jgi:hypothetical protein